MYKIAFALFSVAAALPLEDTVEVKEAKEAFHTVYKSVEAGEHVNLMPVNNDVQAPQIANMYLDDTADVAEAKEAFHAEFKNVEAGGLMAKQAPAPVHEVAKVEVAAPNMVNLVPHVYNAVNALPYHHMYYNTVPNMVNLVPHVYNAVKTVKTVVPNTVHTYAVPHHYAYTYPYHVMPVVQQAEPAVEEQE